MAGLDSKSYFPAQALRVLYFYIPTRPQASSGCMKKASYLGSGLFFLEFGGAFFGGPAVKGLFSPVVGGPAPEHI